MKSSVKNALVTNIFSLIDNFSKYLEQLFIRIPGNSNLRGTASTKLTIKSDCSFKFRKCQELHYHGFEIDFSIQLFDFTLKKLSHEKKLLDLCSCILEKYPFCSDTLSVNTRYSHKVLLFQLHMNL